MKVIQYLHWHFKIYSSMVLATDNFNRHLFVFKDVDMTTLSTYFDINIVNDT